MNTVVAIDDVRLSTATAGERATGLLGFVTLTLAGAVTIDGISLRRTLAGDFVLAFPTRKDRWGNIHPLVRPVDDNTRRVVTKAVLQALGLDACAAAPVPPRQGESRP
jgi:DNA-binding cell septation regulator SpoVG